MTGSCAHFLFSMLSFLVQACWFLTWSNGIVFECHVETNSEFCQGNMDCTVSAAIYIVEYTMWCRWSSTGLTCVLSDDIVVHRCQPSCVLNSVVEMSRVFDNPTQTARFRHLYCRQRKAYCKRSSSGIFCKQCICRRDHIFVKQFGVCVNPLELSTSTSGTKRKIFFIKSGLPDWELCNNERGICLVA